MLCLCHRGEEQKLLTIDANTENLDRVLAFIDTELEAADCPMKKQMQIDVAVEEIFVNIANYAYAPDSGEAVIGIRLEDNGVRQAVITFSDSGVPYDPLKKQDPDISASAEERPVGGLGIFMAKKLMDDMTYQYQDGRNILTIRKTL